MRNIAYKKTGLGFMFGFLICSGLFFIVLGSFTLSDTRILLIGIFAFAIGLGCEIDFLRYPSILISVNDRGNLVLYNGKEIYLESIIDVSYRQAHARGIRYKYGYIIIQTATKNYYIRYVSHCEGVAKEITSMMYDRKIEKAKNSNTI